MIWFGHNLHFPYTPTQVLVYLGSWGWSLSEENFFLGGGKDPSMIMNFFSDIKRGMSPLFHLHVQSVVMFWLQVLTEPSTIISLFTMIYPAAKVPWQFQPDCWDRPTAEQNQGDYRPVWSTPRLPTGAPCTLGQLQRLPACTAAGPHAAVPEWNRSGGPHSFVSETEAIQWTFHIFCHAHNYSMQCPVINQHGP